MSRIFINVFVLITAANLLSQNNLSSLNSFSHFPIYTTYASAMQDTKYSTDQGYQLVWFDPDKGILLKSEQSGEFGVIFRSGNILKFKLSGYSKPPVITTSYSNLFKLITYPFQDIRVEFGGLVKDSETLILDLSISNESSFPQIIDLFPFIDFPGNEFTELGRHEKGLSFTHERKKDSWMKEHNIPFREEMHNLLLADVQVISSGSYQGTGYGNTGNNIYLINDLRKNGTLNGIITNNKTAAFQISVTVDPGESKIIRLIRTVSDKPVYPTAADSVLKVNSSVDLSRFILKNENIYMNIPAIKFKDKDAEAVYWNAFNLIRQCMMKAEGKCSYNYYVFSREPKWGWGYGGQVFHESLTMLAYAFLDPLSAMNSQRVYFERQHPAGYINYRTGPYLDEQIPVDGQLTSSAPWFNWQNYEIYKITDDKSFLAEAYKSGKRFYDYYVSGRDTDKDGLCEWGADAVLESVRDARVAVWDEVGEPVNFESVDCNIMLVKEAKSLAAMAEILGKAEDEGKYLEEAEKRTALINKYMWDDETGFYYHVDKKNHSFSFRAKNDLKRKEIIAFLALWAGVADKNQAEKLVGHLNNPEEFNRKYGVPSLSADDPYYNPIGYWNGPVWLPWQYLLFRGLIDYGYIREAEDLTERITKNIAFQLKTNHYFWEFYSADDLQAGWNKAYIWSGIIARFYIDLNNLNK